MNIKLLRKHISTYKNKIESKKINYDKDMLERNERRIYYRSWTAEKMQDMNEDEFAEYISQLWSMIIWGNKKYVVDKLIKDNGFGSIKKQLSLLVWGKEGTEKRWDTFRGIIKGMGPAMMSEILSHVHPEECMLWNRRAYVGLHHLGVENLPRYSYQMTGSRYCLLSEETKTIAKELQKEGFEDADLLTADYLIWEELQVEKTLSKIHLKKVNGGDDPDLIVVDSDSSVFIHNEIRDKLSDIGEWLGLTGRTEVKVAEGSKVDAIWEQTVGNMGRVIYVFEVQTKGSIDSLIVNLLKSLNNPAVQGVVAVSDEQQLEKIKKHATGVLELRSKLKYWDYKKVLEIHESLEKVNEEINSLGLVPSGF